MDNYSLSDIAAATNEGGFGGNSAWVLIILFALIFGNGGFGFGGNSGRVATSDDVQRSTDFAALERQNNEGVAATRQAAYDVTGSIKDANYNTLGEIRDLQAEVGNGLNGVNAALAAGFSNMQNCCCEIQRGIDSVNYNGAINTASINATTISQTQKILDAIATNRMADMQNQINQLQLQSALCGVVRYPNATTYSAGYGPFCNAGCGCNI